MINLDLLSQEEKNIIGQIVDGYDLSFERMKNDGIAMSDSPGLWLFSILYNFDESKNKCHISLSNKDGELAADFYLKDYSDRNIFNQQVKLRKAEFMASAVFVYTLFKDNLIFFEEDKECMMPKFEENTEDKMRSLHDDDFFHCTEIIRSQIIFDFINEFYWSKIIPSPNLIQYRNNKYKTPERERHNKTVLLNRWAIIVAIISMIVSVLATIFSIWWDNTHSSMKIDDDQFERLLLIFQNDADNLINNVIE